MNNESGASQTKVSYSHQQCVSAFCAAAMDTEVWTEKIYTRLNVNCCPATSEQRVLNCTRLSCLKQIVR